MLTFDLGLNNKSFIAGINASMASVSGFIRDAKREFGEVGGAMTAPFRALGGAVSGVVGFMHTLNGAVELVGQAAGAVGQVMRGAFGQIAGATNAAAEMESVTVAFETMLKSSEKAAAALGDIKALAASTPFELPELTKAGQSLISFGDTAETVTDTLRRIGDIASGIGAPIGEIAEIFGKARVNGTLFAEDLNQLTGRGIPVITELAKILKVPTARIKELGSEGRLTFPLLEQAFRNMTGTGGQFAGMMEKQSGTAKGLWSTLRDAWGELQRVFGGPVNDALKPFLRDAIKLIESFRSEAKAAGQAVADWMTTVRGGFMGGFGWEALLMPLKIGFLEIANTFSNALMVGAANAGKFLDELRIRMLSFTWSKEREDAQVAKSNADWDHTIKVMGGDAGPFDDDIRAAKKRYKQMQKEAVVNVTMADAAKVIDDAGSRVQAWLGNWDKVGAAMKIEPDVAPGIEEALDKAAKSGEKKAKEAGEKLGHVTGTAFRAPIEAEVKSAANDIGKAVDAAADRWEKQWSGTDKWTGRRTGTEIAEERRQKNEEDRDWRRYQRRTESRDRRANAMAQREAFDPMAWLKEGRGGTRPAIPESAAMQWLREGRRDLAQPASPYRRRGVPETPDAGKDVMATANAHLAKIAAAVEKLEVWQ